MKVGLIILLLELSAFAEVVPAKSSVVASGVRSNTNSKLIPLPAASPGSADVKTTPTGVESPSPLSLPLGASGAGSSLLTLAQIDNLFSTSIAEFAFKLRDPFKMPVVIAKPSEIKTDLEKYPLNEFKLVGVLTGLSRMRAMLVGPDGKTYFVSEKMKIGNSGGVISRIASEEIRVREKIINAIGQVENMDSSIKLAAPDDGKASNKEQSGMQGQSAVRGR
jgi:type IV pilus assembly protein PilP